MLKGAQLHFKSKQEQFNERISVLLARFDMVKDELKRTVSRIGDGRHPFDDMETRSYAVQQIIHEILWMVPNLNLEQLIRDAVETDKAESELNQLIEEQKLPSLAKDGVENPFVP